MKDATLKQIKIYKEKIKAFEKKIKLLKGVAPSPEITALNNNISKKKPDADLINTVRSGFAAKANRKKRIRTPI